ncbi:hypothetical protein [Sphingomonas flavescens]|jgi:cytochrome c5|uniref:hypothetical protein n=1 Tax=Sphingomonas flavescens TaxID=3132797 RepID=UPI002805D1B0|nr:hypothetical protein [Sphingomonas limnosediminicola]
MRLTLSIPAASVVASLLLLGSAVAHGTVKGSSAAPAKAAAASTNDDTSLLEKHCSSCHAVDQVTAANKNASDWAETMDRMIDHGMQITPEDNKRIQQFLVAHYGAK